MRDHPSIRLSMNGMIHLAFIPQPLRGHFCVAPFRVRYRGITHRVVVLRFKFHQNRLTAKIEMNAKLYAQKIWWNWTCGFRNMRVDRQTNRQTYTLITILWGEVITALYGWRKAWRTYGIFCTHVWNFRSRDVITTEIFGCHYTSGRYLDCRWCIMHQ